MRLAVVLEQRFSMTPDQRAWTADAFPYHFWTRYLTAFDEVVVVARAEGHDEPPFEGLRVDGPGVRLAPVPVYHGPGGLLPRLPAVVATLRHAVATVDAVLLRTPGALSNLAFRLARPSGRPLAVEVVGDPQEVFARGVVAHPLRVVWQRWFARSLRHQCRHATVACYVTRETLQRRYPPASWAYTTWYSNVDLPADAFAEEPLRARLEGPFRIVTVGSLDQLYKGVDVVLDAVAECRDRGLDARLSIVGDGRRRAELERHARALGLSVGPDEAVSFVGRLPGAAAVRSHLRGADLFILGSRTEGMPRALLEAMAQGLPCVATSVGGIPEVLCPDDLVPPGDARALAELVGDVWGDPARRDRMAARNLVAARAYSREELAARSCLAYQALADAARVPTPRSA